MAAKDYTFAEGLIDIYLVKKKKRDDGLMSADRRPLSKEEQIYIAENFLRRYCAEHNTDNVVISEGEKPIFKMVLLDK